jgi:phosphoribosylformylglycinamidine cyclo-ligase
MKRMTYKAAGVDIQKGNEFVKSVITGIGSFGGLFGLDKKKYKNPVLVSSTDGVGTKLLIAQQSGIHHTVGVDLVAMCVNDVATTGAEPLFFLDYISTGKIKPQTLKNIVKGIVRGCRQAGYALIGGETAEMPGLYKPGEYDLAGFCVGITDKSKIVDGKRVKSGDLLLGLASSGLHSNGYSLVRKALSAKETKANLKDILKPTRIYVQPVLSLMNALPESRQPLLKGIAHITGGSFKDKLGRILPQGIGIEIDKSSWPKPKIFGLVQERGNIAEAEMYKVFNMGIGMVVIISSRNLKQAQDIISKHKIQSWVIGQALKTKNKVRLV